MYLKEGKAEKAYVWSQVAWQLGQDNLDKNSMKNIVTASEDEYDDWDDQAEDIVDQIKDGQFKGRYSSS